MERRSNVVKITLALAVSACAAEPDERALIPGETLAAPQGMVVEAPVDGDAIEVAVFWNYYPSLLGEGAPRVVPGERVTVTGELPAAFEMGALSPPPELVLQGSAVLFYEPGAPRVVEGTIVTVRAGANYDDIALSDMIGSSRVHSIAYVERDIEPGSYADYLLGPLGAGFHLIERTPFERDCENADADSPAWHEHADGTATCSPAILRAAPNGFETPIEVLGPVTYQTEDGRTVEMPYFQFWM